MGIREFLDRLRSKKAKAKEFEDEMRVQERYYDKKKSADERELERFHEEHRQKQIKAELENWRKSKQEEIEFGHQILETPNMYSKEKSIIMKQKNLFNKKSNLNTKGGLFFK